MVGGTTVVSGLPQVDLWHQSNLHLGVGMFCG